MFPTSKRTRTARVRHLRLAAFPARRVIAQVLAFMLLAQVIAPSALMARSREITPASRGIAPASRGGGVASSPAAALTKPGARSASVPTVAAAAEDFGVVLTALGTAFSGHAGIEHHQPLRKLVVSSHNPTGMPLNFETLDADGTHRPYSNVAGLTGGLKLATARDDGAGMSRGGFSPGELFSGTGAPGVIARVAPDGSSVQNPWVTLAGEAEPLSGGLFVDRSGVFGGDLLAVTTSGGVWRINSAGAAARIANLGTRLEGVTSVPDDATKYGPWAGKILVGAKDQGTVYAVDAQGNATSYSLGLNPADIRIIPAHENFYGLDPADGKIWGAPDDAFAGIIGDILIAQGSPGVLARVRWNGTEFEVGQIAAVSSWGQITFSPAALSEIGGVKQVYDKIAVVRHAPELDGGRIEGALWQLLPENVALDGTDVITSDLLVPGKPSVTVGSGKPSFGGIIEGVESKQPTGYSISISNNAVLRHVITRTNPLTLVPVAAPTAPAGTRDVSLTKAGESIGDAATLRHLSISGKAGAVAVPPGAYGKFTAAGHTQFVLGVEGATVPSVYDLEDLSLSGGSELRLAGPVKLNVRGNVSLSGSTVGAADDPRRLLLSVAQGAVGVTGGGVLYGIIRIPEGTVSIGGNGRIRGTVTCDRLNIFGNGVLQITETDVAPPPVNRPPTADAGPDQTVTLPTDTVSLNGTATDDGLPSGSTLVTTWTKVSGPGPVSFSAPGNPVTTATFSEPGMYVLRLSANDSLLTVADEMRVEVVPRNQPPDVNAGADQTIELPNGATLGGVVSDDALPRGSTVTKTWSVASGPGEVVFADAHDLATAVTFAAPGTYVLRLTADDTEFTVSDEVTFTVHPENQPPVVNAGADQTVRLPNAATLNGTATDDGWPSGSTLTTTWTKVSGPGTVTFANPASPVTAAQFGIEGTYVLRLTADDSRFNVSDECVVTVLPENVAPVVNAGTDREITFLEGTTLNGTATDDGLPVGSVLEVMWTKVSGPGTVTFANADRPVTPAAFSAPGTYVLRLTGTDSQLSASDETTVVVKPKSHASRVYTLDADFDQGALINVAHSPADQLQLDSTTRSFNFIWVAVSTKGTIVKINTETGAIIGEYFTAPQGQPRDPSRTTVDLNGNVWAGNRAGNSVVHIGLVENGQCVDRNNNGVIDTSTGFNDIRAWTNANGANTNGGVTTSQDECVLHYTKVNSSGTRHVSVTKDNDIWVSGTSGQRFDLIDGKTGLIKRAEPSVGYGGYGGLIDRNNVIWSANSMLRWDTAKPLNGPNGTNWRGYSHPSYGLCIDSQGNVYNTSYGNGTVRKFSPNGTLVATYNQGSAYAQGCVVDRNDDLWIAHSLNTSTVGHLKSNGTYVGTIAVGSGPTGVAVDGAGKVWATNYYSGTVSRINPALGPIGGDGVTRVGAVDFTTPYLGGNPYNYSDMTGSTLTGAPNNGTWSAVFDSGMAGAEWGRIGWTAQVCGDGLLSVTVATSENNTTYTQPLAVANGDDPVIPNGRYAKITVRFERASSGESPVLYDLSIGTVGFPLATPANIAPGIDAGADQTLEGVTKTALRASVCDDALPSNKRLALNWSQVAGPGTATFTKPNSLATDVSFSAVGTYTLRMTATDSAHTGSDTLIVTVLPGNQPPVVNAGVDRTVETCQATLQGTVTDDGKPSGGSLLVSWSKLTGPGVVTFANPNAASTDVNFAKPGVYVLRLSAGDGALGSSDDVIVTVRASGAPIYYEPTNYLSDADSPFKNLDNNYFHRENFEDHLLNTPGVTASAGGVTSVVFGPTVHDSVDGDDGAIDGSGLGGDSYFSVNGASGIKFTFNAAALGSLPTHAGLVWTDGNGQVTFEAFDAQGVSMGVRGPFNFADAVNNGTTGEDRFLGAFNRGGISAIKVTNSSGGIEIDHLQYGYERSANNAPSANAGNDQAISLPLNSVTLNGSAVDDGLPGCGSLTYSWSKTSGPGTVTFSAPTAAATTATFGTPGIYVLRLTVSDSELSSSDEVTVRFNQPNQAPQVNAGADQTIPANGTATLNGAVSDDGLPHNAPVTSTWSMVSGPGLVTFANPSTPSTTATFSEAGTYVLRLSATDTALSAMADTIVTVTPPNRAPEVNAGANLTVTLPGTARLAGTVADDGLPFGGTLSVAWSQVSGTGTVAFANPAAAVTTATFSAAGTYVLRLSAGDTELTSADELTVTVNPAAPNQAPVVEAGAAQSIELNSNLVRNPGNDDELVDGEIRGWTETVGNLWTRGFSGTNDFPESVNGGSFFYAGETASAELRQDLDVSGFAATIASGTQSFEWKAYVRSRAESTPDTARIILEYRNAANTAMIARLDSGEVSSTNAWRLLEDARPAPAGTGWIRIRLISTRHSGTTNDAYFDGLSLRALTGAGVKLTGTVADDGLPAGGALAINWTKVSGPGAVAFHTANAASTSATFSDAGTYVLRLTAHDSELESTDEVTVTVKPRNGAPVVNAGADQTITLPNTASLDGSVTDDGKPEGGAITSLWTKVSGPGAVTFANAAALQTTASFGVAGTYVLRLAATDAEYNGGDTLTIIVNPAPANKAPVVNAGADQVVNPPSNSATLNGTATDDGLPAASTLTYVWTKVSGPGAVTFSAPTAATTTATFGEAGAYVLRLSAGDSQLTGADDVLVTLNGTNKAPVVNAGADQTAGHPATVNLGGTATDDGLPVGSALTYAWSVVSGPGAVTFGNAAQLNTTASCAVAGTYVLRLTASDSALSAADEVTITQTGPPHVGISSPAEGATITTRTDFIGTVSEGSSWRLEYRLNEEGGVPIWTSLASGNTPVTNARLGTFDPTTQLNGIYTVRLVATNAAGQTSTVGVTAVVEGEQKVGNFSLSFTDASVPVAGLPMQVTRTYDSRDKRMGDFGVGWTLGIHNIRVQESGKVGEGWQGTVGGGFFPSYCAQPSKLHLVTITMPDGEIFKFDASINPQCSTLYPLRETTISYRPLTGTNASLTPIGDATVYVSANFPGEVQLLDYSTLELKDFSQYRLTLPDGRVMLLDQRDGLKQMTDANGNILTVGHGGITHSSGKSITFTRDAQGRIQQITDPNGAQMSYGYDARGDLVSFKDAANNTTTFAYNSAHGMLSIKDPRGIQPVRNEYDDAGRLVKHIDAFGKEVVYTHNPDARQEIVTDRLGKVTVLEYDQRGNVVRTTDPQGNVSTATYDSRSRKLSETNAGGKTISYTYDAQDNRASVTDPLGNVTRFSYNERKQPLTITDPLGRVTTHTYDPAGNLLSTKDVAGNTTSSTYNSRGQLETTTDALGGTTRYEYDATGNVTKTIDQLGRATSYTYDANGNRLSQTETRTAPSGAVETLTTAFEFDRLNRVIKTTLPDGSKIETVYNNAGLKIADIDPLGRRTSYEYDEMGRAIRTTHPDATKEEATYDAEGRTTKVVDRAGRATTYAYDAVGRRTKVTYADGTSIGTTYDGLGRVTSATDAAGNKTQFEYDPNCGCSSRLTKVSDPLGKTLTFTYDAQGNRTSSTDARNNTTRFEYDALNRLIKATNPDGTSSTVAYDALGRKTATTDQAGKTTRYEYDKLNRLVAVIDALNQTTAFTYDEIGNLLTQTDANNHTTSYEYDNLNQRTKRRLPTGVSESYTYDVVGQLTSRTDFNGKTTTYTYDSMSRLLQKQPDPSLNQPAVVYTYNATGERATMTDASGTTTYTHDNLGRLTSKAMPQGTLNYTYDAAGNLLTTRSSNSNGVSVNYTYDTLNRLATVTDNRLGNGPTTYGYDDVGNLSNYTYQNGVSSTFTYDSLNRLTNISSGKTSTLASYAYTLGAAGNRLTVAELSGRTVSYTYDALYRLTNETVSSDPHGKNGVAAYTHDKVGNRLSRTSTLPGVGNSTHTYDANDRLTSDTSDPNGNTIESAGKTYKFDFENRIAELNNGAVRIVYDGDGNRVAKTVGGVTTQYLVDDNNLTGYPQVVEELQGGSVVRQYTYGHDLISQRQQIGGEWKESFYGYDGHGSVRYLTDSEGVVTDTYDYDAFGILIHRTGTTPNIYLYSGEQYDPELGMQYLRARYMNQETGRFWTQDTYEGVGSDPVSLHKYLYASADPVNNIDPTGNFSIGDMSAAMGIHGTLSGMSTISGAVVIGLIKRMLYGALAGAAIGGVDAALEGASWVEIMKRAGTGAAWGSVLAPFGALRAAQPILRAFGISMAIVGAADSLQNGNYAQAVFRVATPWMLPWAAGKLRQLLGPLKMTNNGGQPQLSSGGSGGSNSSSTVGGGSGGSGGGSGSGGGGGGSGSGGSGGGSGGNTPAPRLPQDVNVNPTPPPPRPLQRPVGLSPTQNAQVQTDIAAARAAGGTDFRVNQQQVNAAGQRVGTNRPDLQYTDANGRRTYVEYDRPSSNRGPLHQQRILSNDPGGIVILKTIP
jgi:RHS repeat-associated protein